jgi:hypothetical protein
MNPSTDKAGTNWRRSTYSGSTNDNCVEVAVIEGRIHVRDSKSLTSPALIVGPSAWTALLARVKAGAL